MTAGGEPDSVAARSGLIIVDKPQGWTSHDVVARIRRLAGTRRVGHAGTLDPMATGVLVVGVEKATRLLGYLSLEEKEYVATIRLGQATDTGDAEGTVVSGAAASQLSLVQVQAAAAALTGEILQVPPAVSAIKVGGERAYRLARRGQAPALSARPVTVHEFTVSDPRPAGPSDSRPPGPGDSRPPGPGDPRPAGLLDVTAVVRCSSGTYVRALARDLGESLSVGGHLTMLRRTRVGRYRIEAARTLEQLAAGLVVIPLAQAAAANFPQVHLTAEETVRLAHGARLRLEGPAAATPATVAAYAPDGTLVALATVENDQLRPLAVFTGPSP